MNPIKKARLEHGMSVFELGAKVGVAGATISRYETGARRVSVAMAKRLESVLGVEWYKLIDTIDSEQRGA